MAPARAARDRVPAGLPALPRARGARPASASRSTPRCRSRSPAAPTRSGLQGTTAESDPLYAGGHQPTLLFRLQNFWQLNRSTYAQLGFTGTGGNNDDEGLRSRLAGLDFRLTYRPPEAGTRREITLRAEGYRLHATELGTTTNRYGTFVDLNAKLTRRWVLGDPLRLGRGAARRWLTPNGA